MDLIASKTGIEKRYIAAPGECASDLGVEAANKLFQEYNVSPDSIDYLLFCTQTPDYPLPTTACIIQDRLGLRTNIGALDFNLGCSGYVYGLSLADSLIQSGMAKRILFITAETYSHYIDKADRSLRTIFSDAATATLVESSPVPTLSTFELGTDGKGAGTLIVNEQGARPKEGAIPTSRRKRWASELFMDGPALITFAVESIPKLVDSILEKANIAKPEVDLFLLHQATLKMMEQLQDTLEIKKDQMPLELKDFGNTVSSTLPILIHELRNKKILTPKQQNMLIGFGVGWSWGGCLWQDTYLAK